MKLPHSRDGAKLSVLFVYGVMMLKPDDLFNGTILDMACFGRAVDEFANQSSFFYHGWDMNGVDLYPQYPICVESDQGGQLVWIMGLVIGNRPGKALLVGASKVRGFKSNIHSAFEVLPGIPAAMNTEARQTTLRSIRKRMRNGVAILARRADLVAYNDPREYTNAFLSILQEPVLDGEKDRSPREPAAVGR
jgi:hypothetical protein